MGVDEHDTAISDTIEVGSSSGSRNVSNDKREAHEVFKFTEDGVEFRTVSWQRASIIFLKIQFAMSILSVPAAVATLGAVGGALSIIGWAALNTCMLFAFRTLDGSSQVFWSPELLLESTC